MKTIPVKTFYLQMHSPPERSVPPPIDDVEVRHVEQPTVEFYRFLYDTVGDESVWLERRMISRERLLAIIHDPRVEIYVPYVAGEPAGFGELDRSVDNEVQLMYFGLMPQFIGKGLGKYFLSWIVSKAWTYAPQRVWLHTCELDHKAALPLYRKAGFVLFDERTVDHVAP